MVTVTIKKSENKGKVSVVGHAGGRGRDGGDIVCAAASTVMTMLCQNLEDEVLFSYRKYNLAEGNSFARYHVNEGYEAVANRVLEGCLLGFRMLAYSYPECVRVIEEN